MDTSSALATQADIAIPNVTWEAVQRAIAVKGHPPVVVFLARSDYGRGTPQNLRAAAQNFFSDGSAPIVLSSLDPRVFEENKKTIKASLISPGAAATLVFKNGGAPTVFPYPT